MMLRSAQLNRRRGTHEAGSEVWLSEIDLQEHALLANLLCARAICLLDAKQVAGLRVVSLESVKLTYAVGNKNTVS
jgi:hypothetical protein